MIVFVTSPRVGNPKFRQIRNPVTREDSRGIVNNFQCKCTQKTAEYTFHWFVGKCVIFCRNRYRYVAAFLIWLKKSITIDADCFLITSSYRPINSKQQTKFYLWNALQMLFQATVLYRFSDIPFANDIWF